MMNIIQKIAANKVRREFGSFDKKRDAGQTTPDDLIRFDDIVYGDDKKFPRWQPSRPTKWRRRQFPRQG